MSDKKLIRLSYQVFNEYYRTVVYKLSPGMPVNSAREDVRDLSIWNPQKIDLEVMEVAFELSSNHKVSWLDSLILASALIQNCKLVLSEDLSHGSTYRAKNKSLEVVNPFK